MSSDPYSPEVRARFADPAHAGSVDGLRVRRSGPEARIALSARLDGGRFAELRFLAWGCPHLIAACDFACERLEGAPVAGPGDVDATSIIEKLGIPIEKTGRILLLEDALADLRSAAERMI